MYVKTLFSNKLVHRCGSVLLNRTEHRFRFHSCNSFSEAYTSRELLQSRPMSMSNTKNECCTTKDGIQTIVVCGPSGSGKTTLLNMLTAHFKDSFNFSVSHTTRKPRANEENGKSYYFVDVPTFERMISNNEFVEYAKFSSNYYGTSYRELSLVKNSGRIPILDVDIRGVISLKKINFDAKYVFITTPSFEILERNLRKRGSESELSIQRRLAHAIEDIKVAEGINFDLVIVNSELEDSIEKFINFVKDDVNKLHRV